MPDRRHRRLGQGLEAIGLFLAHVPKDSGVAFIVVQHLDPAHKGMLVELLQRGTTMPVEQAKDGTEVAPEHVYVIPPNKDMSILHGRIHLLPQSSPRGLNLPIDFFLRSLAEDQGESGMGSDGTLGLRAIKEKGGAAFVQGVLSLGSAETIGSFSGLFAPLEAKARIYRRTEQAAAAAAIEFPTAPIGMPSAQGGSENELEAQPKSAAPNLQALADRVVVQRFAPVAALCNDKGDLLYFSRRAGKYLEPAAGKANLNVFSMAREGLRFELSRAFAAALREDRVITVSGVQVGTNGGTQTIELTVHKLAEPKELRGTVIAVFTDVAPGPVAEKQPITPPKRSFAVRGPRSSARRSSRRCLRFGQRWNASSGKRSAERPRPQQSSLPNRSTVHTRSASSPSGMAPASRSSSRASHLPITDQRTNNSERQGPKTIRRERGAATPRGAALEPARLRAQALPRPVPRASLRGAGSGG